jgi:hypothetical protein
MKTGTSLPVWGLAPLPQKCNVTAALAAMRNGTAGVASTRGFIARWAPGSNPVGPPWQPGIQLATFGWLPRSPPGVMHIAARQLARQGTAWQGPVAALHQTMRAPFLLRPLFCQNGSHRMPQESRRGAGRPWVGGFPPRRGRDCETELRISSPAETGAGRAADHNARHVEAYA